MARTETMLTTNVSIQILEKTLEDLCEVNITEDALKQTMHNLTTLVKASIEDTKLRHDLAKLKSSWRLIRAIIDQNMASSNLELKVRLQRGSVILARNLLSVDRELAEEVELRQSIFRFCLELERHGLEQSIYKNCIVSCFQCLSNLTVNKKEHNPAILHELVAVFKEDYHWDEATLIPIFTYFNNIIDTSDLLYLALSKGEGKPIFKTLISQFEGLDFENELNSYGVLIVKIFKKLIVHESYLRFITTHNTEDDTIRYLHAAEVIITSKELWEVFELTVILSWIYELFQKTIPKVQEFFKKVSSIEDPKFIYNILHSTLHVLSSLSKFEHAKKFLLSYEGVQNLVALLGTIHQNVTPKKLKDSDKKDISYQTVVEYQNFPFIKSLIIEILSALIYKDFEVQELVREVHGLELILSNCIIDDNEPFIKERSIVCLRFLLLNNDKNQEFVAKLEAKEAIQDDALDEAGFEVEIVDGKVKMKQKSKAEP